MSRCPRVVYDGRGTGLSDPVIGAPSLDDRVQDLSCVFEAAGLTQASLGGVQWHGGHIGARIGALAGPSEVLASRTVRDLSAGSGLRFESLGPQQLKGIAEAVEVYRVTTD